MKQVTVTAPPGILNVQALQGRRRHPLTGTAIVLAHAEAASLLERDKPVTADAPSSLTPLALTTN